MAIIDLPKWIYPIKRLVRSDQVGRWCQLPYPNHPQGCPKHGNDKKCPPQAQNVEEYFNLSRPLYFVHSEFNLATHIARMEEKYPEWSLMQCKCVLYWQSTSRNQLKQRASEAAALLGTNARADVPEAMGVNVYATARIAGLHLERIKYLSICRHVALIGTELKGQMALF